MPPAAPGSPGTEEPQTGDASPPFRLAALALIRPALELAWVVARTGEESSPPLPAPGPVRKLLHFSRLPDQALATLRRSVEDDPQFRTRVAGAATEESVGRPSWLWLARPDGWDDELGRLDHEEARSAAAAEERHQERGARRRLAAAEEATRRAEAAMADAQAAAARANEELTTERQARRAAEGREETLTTRVAQLGAQVAGLAARAEAAERAGSRLGEAESALLAERDRLRQRVEELEAQVAGAGERLSEPAAAGTETPQDATARLADAAAAARELGAALAAAAEAFGGPPSPGGPDEGVNRPVGTWLYPPGTLAGSVPPDTGTPSGTGVAGLRPGSLSRRPSPLPPAVFEDSVEAALHLLRIPSMILLVDGYNVSLTAWPNVAIPEQRRRLVDTLAGLSARTGADVRVVFDGAAQAEPRAGAGPPRSSVRVSFSPPGIEADEVLIEQIEMLPPFRSVTVATSDRRVQDEARRRGANVISSGQLLGAMTGR